MEPSFAWAMEHIGNLNAIDAETVRMIRDEMPSYCWILTAEDNPKARIIFCDSCGSRTVEEKKGGKWPSELRQGEPGRCPVCREQVIGKYVSKSHNFTDKLDAIFYQKSAKDPNVIVGIAANCYRNYAYDDEPWTVETDIRPVGVTVFQYGEGGFRWQKKVAEWGINGGIVPTSYGWEQVRRVSDMSFMHGMSLGFHQSPPRVLLRETLEDAITGTPFERAWDEDYLAMDHGHDATEALTMIARYPSIEYMTKLGLTDFLARKVRGTLPAGVVNWRGKNVKSVLRISAQRLGEIKAEMKHDRTVELSPELLMLVQWADKDRIRCDTKTLIRIAKHETLRHSGIERLKKAVQMHQKTRQTKALKYIARTIGSRVYVSDIQDYWEECEWLGASLTDDATAFPKDFPEAHARNQKRMKLMKSKEKDELIAEHLPLLTKRYAFSFGGLILRPAESSAEVIREGEVLGHCVGGYVDRYAQGATIICVLRRAVEPDTPWRTVEISKDGRLVQDRGYKNDTHMGIQITDGYRAALDLFWQAWRERGAA